MSRASNDRIQSVWKSQQVLTVSITPEEVRVNAAQFERQTHRRNMVDLVSFAVVLAFMVIGVVILQGALARVGALLLALWAIIGLYSVRRFHSLTDSPSPETGPVSCAAWYQRQLERQRDVALSRPWGLALGMPGLALVLIGYVVDNDTPWALSAILGGVGVFLGIAAIIHGQILAGRWQKEIDSLQTLRND